ncbi:protein amalgam-like isoform x2 [Plakobranchus ocellatus]|uniref:Protein amalgam-like isoform x2 n=1 Tax=Plakobranchus ocellatus TaxID=259542 RepID=A0AAV4E1Y0_9GAST|nr:protein amalgam-like isoform x2 [Plakobranchus ocellatus]
MQNLAYATDQAALKDLLNEPPKIIEHLSSPSSVRVREGDTVELVCNATGTPTPEVIWYEKPEEGSGVEKKPPIAPGLKTNKNCMYSFKEIQNPGEVLVIYNATRYCAEVYQCMAYNQVRPAAFRDIRVNVEFAPEVTLPTKKIGQILGKATILECSIAAYPHNLNKWKRNGKDIRDQAKYTIELYKEKHNTITLSLRIHSITPEDYGEYECFALNNIGQDSETMILYEYRRETTSTTTTTTTLAPWSRPDNNYNNGDLYPDINSRSGNNGYNTGNSPRYDPNRVKYPDHRNQAGGGWDDARDPYDGWEERKPNGYNREAESNSVRAGRRGDRDTAGHVRPHSLLINIILCISVFYTLMS